MDEYVNEISIAHFRLKSVRRKKRMQRTHNERTLRKLHRERKAIYKRIWSLGWEPLDPPVQKGWKRSFVLRDDVARSKDAKFFQGILDKINTFQYSWRKDFKVKRRHRGKKIYVIREQHLEQVDRWSLKKKNFSEAELKYFDLVLGRHAISKEIQWMYIFDEPWRFQLKVEPNIHRWKRVKDFNLERRANEIEQYLNHNHLEPRLSKIIHGRYQWRLRYWYEGDLFKYGDNPLRNRSFSDILSEYLPEEQPHTVTLKPSKPEGFFMLLVTTQKSTYRTSNGIKLTLLFIKER